MSISGTAIGSGGVRTFWVWKIVKVGTIHRNSTIGSKIGPSKGYVSQKERRPPQASQVGQRGSICTTKAFRSMLRARKEAE